jgi:peptidoglycan glycosyltransferase
MMRPHVVEATLDHDGNELSRTVATPWRTVMTPLTAGILNGLMIQVVENGTASCCLDLDNGVQAAAKTGTAQLNATGEPQRSHAWIIAFAPAEAPRYAIAVMLKGTTDEISAGTGGRLAGPIAERVLNTALDI